MKVEYIGIIAGILTTACFVPQVFKVVQTDNTHSLSLLYCIMLNVGVMLWFVYGCLVKDFIIITANALTLVSALIILIWKVKNIFIKKEVI